MHDDIEKNQFAQGMTHDAKIATQVSKAAYLFAAHVDLSVPLPCLF